MQQILIKGTAGMSHMLCSTTAALEISEYFDSINIQNVLYHNWNGWECFNNIYDVKHKNFSSNQFVNDSNKQIIPIQQLDKNNLSIPSNCIIQIDANRVSNFLTKSYFYERFFDTFSLTQKYQNILEKRMLELNSRNYVAVQIRGSDICRNKNISQKELLLYCEKTLDIVKEKHKDEVILLTSDNQDVLIKYVDNNQIFSYSLPYQLYKNNIKLNFDQRLHCTNIEFTQGLYDLEYICSDTALDFFLLINSTSLYADIKSGFGQVVNQLHKKAKKLL